MVEVETGGASRKMQVGVEGRLEREMAPRCLVERFFHSPCQQSRILSIAVGALGGTEYALHYSGERGARVLYVDSDIGRGPCHRQHGMGCTVAQGDTATERCTVHYCHGCARAVVSTDGSVAESLAHECRHCGFLAFAAAVAHTIRRRLYVGNIYGVAGRVGALLRGERAMANVSHSRISTMGLRESAGSVAP